METVTVSQPKSVGNVGQTRLYNLFSKLFLNQIFRECDIGFVLYFVNYFVKINMCLEKVTKTNIFVEGLKVSVFKQHSPPLFT